MVYLINSQLTKGMFKYLKIKTIIYKKTQNNCIFHKYTAHNFSYKTFTHVHQIMFVMRHFLFGQMSKNTKCVCTGRDNTVNVIIGGGGASNETILERVILAPFLHFNVFSCIR